MNNIINLEERRKERFTHVSQETKYSRRQTKTVLKVYVEVERPIDNGDIAGDFEWRRTHKRPTSPKNIKRLLKRDFNVDPDMVDVAYDRNCGCSMCPCSPGYRVKVKDSKDFRDVLNLIGQKIEGFLPYYETPDAWLTIAS